MKRFVNLRLPVLFACLTAVGALLGYAFTFYEIDPLYFIISVPVFGIIFIVLTVIYKSYKPLVCTLAAAAFFLAGAAGCCVTLSNYEKCDLNLNENSYYTVMGTVAEKNSYGDYEYVILDKAYADGTKLSGKVYARLPEKYGEYCDVGYKVNFKAFVYFYDTFPYGKLNYNAKDNVKYGCSIDGEITSEYGFSFFGSIRAEIRKTLYNNLENETASVCYGMLTGNTQDIDESTLNSFRYGGIAHIFAVSGLHISLVFMLLSALLRKLRVNKYVSAAVCLFFVFFYAAVCGFTPSSVRAAVMCAVMALCKLAYFKYDGMNSLAVAVIILLLINPLNLFSVGFQLSVCAVGAITMFSKLIESKLHKLKVPREIGSKLGVTLSAQAGTLPVMLASFGYVSGAGLILNLVIIPIISLLFPILLIGTLISAVITPVAPFLLPVAATPLDAVISFLLNAGFEKALISGFGAGLFVPLYFTGLLALSDKLNLKFPARTISVFCCVAVLTCFVLGATYLPGQGYKVTVSAFEVLIKSSQGSVLIVTESVNSSKVSSLLNENYVSSLGGVIILGGEECVATFGNLNVDCNSVYIYDGYLPVQPYGDAAVRYVHNFELCGVNFQFSDGFNLSADCGGVKLGVCTSKQLKLDSCDLLISQYAHEDTESWQTVYFDNVYDYGNFTFNIKRRDR